jgi:cell division protein FtsB
MTCPVCQSSGLPDDVKKCPQCDSDLEAFHMTRKMEGVSRNRLSFAVVASLLFIVVVILWLITGMSGKTSDEPPPETADIAAQKEEMKKMSNRNAVLIKENEDLKTQIANMKTEKKNRKKEYVVREGETLFGIARRVYGNGFKYVDLARDNNIEEPEKILTGQKLIIYY